METTINTQATSADHYFSSLPFLTDEQITLVEHCKPFIDLDTVIKSTYKSSFSDPSFKTIKGMGLSLAALTEVKNNHFRYILANELAGEVAYYCFIDIGTLYAKVGMSESLLKNALHLLCDALLADLLSQDVPQKLKVNWADIEQSFHLLFARFEDLALNAHEYYNHMRCLKNHSTEEVMGIRKVSLSDAHMMIAMNPLTDYLKWHEISDYSLTLLEGQRPKQVFLDLSGLSGREEDEKELVIFDIQQFCFIKNIELFIIGAEDNQDEDVLAFNEDIEDTKVHFYSDLVSALYSHQDRLQ